MVLSVRDRGEANLPQPQRHYRLPGESFNRSFQIAAALHFLAAPDRKSLSIAHSDSPIEWNGDCHRYRSGPQNIQTGLTGFFRTEIGGNFILIADPDQSCKSRLLLAAPIVV
jgi:hypothetical protein